MHVTITIGERTDIKTIGRAIAEVAAERHAHAVDIRRRPVAEAGNLKAHHITARRHGDTGDSKPVHLAVVSPDGADVQTEHVPLVAAPGQLNRRSKTKGNGCPANGLVLVLVLDFNIGILRENRSGRRNRESGKAELDCLLHVCFSP